MSVGRAFVATWHAVLTTRTLLSTTLLAVVLYAFYYPAPYAHETAQRLPVIVVDQAGSVFSRALVRDLEATRAMTVAGVVTDLAQARARMRRGEADGVILLTPGLERQALTGAPGAGVAVWVNATYLLRASTIGAAVAAVLRDLATERLVHGGQVVRAGPPVTIVRVALFNPTGGYKGYVFPAVAVIIVQQTLLFGVAIFIGMRRRAGNWRMGHAQFLGSWAAFTSMGILSCLLLFGLMFWLQGVPLEQNMAGMLAAVPLFSAAVAGAGLWIGSFFDHGERAMVILGPTSVPFFFLTGTAWPLDQMPRFLQAIAQLIPSTAGVHTFVPLNQMGATLSDVRGELGVLAALALGYGGLAWWRIAGLGPAQARTKQKAQPTR
ncbi:ABC transporter permease [Sphingomonas sp. PAMC 26605]|uniref:ABC transporter permease n=1 Tax=Sphingomonas sp. PAMC 26605 TaxID=1112214 RepID=UPI00026CA6F0|nr:ABC transporter permease [Sphingomonas sp. PAMC 26605]